MKSNNKRGAVLTRTVILIIPLSVLIVSYTASKLHYFDMPTTSSYMMLFLLFYTIYISYKYWKKMHCREVKYCLLFFALSLPAYLMSDFTSVESVLRLFALIAFVPLGFLSGLAWGYQYNQVEIERRNIIITVLLVPAVIVILMIIKTSFSAMAFSEAERDYVFGMLIFLPLILYYRRRILPILFLFVASYICIISSKRTGLLCVASIIPFIFISSGTSISKRTTRFFSVIIMIFFIGLMVSPLLPSISPEIESSIERFENLDDLSSETRVNMYMRTIDEIRNSGTVSLLFGHGCLGTIKLFGNPTHNDWLEIIYDYGLLPFFSFFCLYLSLIIRVLKSLRRKTFSSLVLLSSLLIFTITTMGNCMFTTPVSVYILLFIHGFSLANLMFSRFR